MALFDGEASISFTDFQLEKGRIDVVCTRRFEGKELRDEVFFELSEPFIPRNDLIAYALATLSRRVYDHVWIDLTISQFAYDSLLVFLTVEKPVQLRVRGIESCTPGTLLNDDHAMLAFSGGFDSLAALCLLPEDVSLVSSDFGPKFAPESNFFRKFSPYIMRSNFRELGIHSDYITTAFMGIASLLYKDYLRIKYHIFGTILDAGPWFYNRPPLGDTLAHLNIFHYAGMENLRMTTGLSEIATAKVILQYKPELINDSLASLGVLGSEKRYRKYLLSKIAAEKLGKSVYLEEAPPPQRKKPFGTRYSVDFLSLFFLKFSSLEEASAMVSDIPAEVIALVDELSLDFFWKLNTNNLHRIPLKLRSFFLQRLAGADILPYNERDWYEFDKVIRMMSTYFPDRQPGLFIPESFSLTEGAFLAP